MIPWQPERRSAANGGIPQMFFHARSMGMVFHIQSVPIVRVRACATLRRIIAMIRGAVAKGTRMTGGPGLLHEDAARVLL